MRQLGAALRFGLAAARWAGGSRVAALLPWPRRRRARSQLGAAAEIGFGCGRAAATVDEDDSSFLALSRDQVPVTTADTSWEFALICFMVDLCLKWICDAVDLSQVNVSFLDASIVNLI
jgi:hypothetical protein